MWDVKFGFLFLHFLLPIFIFCCDNYKRIDANVAYKYIRVLQVKYPVFSSDFN